MIASHPIPRLLLIGNRFSRPEVGSAIIEAVESGVEWVQFRDHEIGEEVFREAAIDLVDRIRSVSRNVLISINTRIQVASMLSAGDCPVAGVHVGTRGPSVEEARRWLRADTPVGISVHSIDEIRGGGIDYFLWSPVFPTKSKPGNRGTGTLELNKAVRSARRISVIAMGGITADNTEECLKTGAYGVAVLSGIIESENIPETVAGYLEAIKKVYPVNDLRQVSFEK